MFVVGMIEVRVIKHNMMKMIEIFGINLLLYPVFSSITIFRKARFLLQCCSKLPSLHNLSLFIL